MVFRLASYKSLLAFCLPDDSLFWVKFTLLRVKKKLQALRLSMFGFFLFKSIHNVTFFTRVLFQEYDHHGFRWFDSPSQRILSLPVPFYALQLGRFFYQDQQVQIKAT